MFPVTYKSNLSSDTSNFHGAGPMKVTYQ